MTIPRALRNGGGHFVWRNNPSSNPSCTGAVHAGLILAVDPGRMKTIQPKSSQSRWCPGNILSMPGWRTYYGKPGDVCYNVPGADILPMVSTRMYGKCSQRHVWIVLHLMLRHEHISTEDRDVDIWVRAADVSPTATFAQSNTLTGTSVWTLTTPISGVTSLRLSLHAIGANPVYMVNGVQQNAPADSKGWVTPSSLPSTLRNITFGNMSPLRTCTRMEASITPSTTQCVTVPNYSGYKWRSISLAGRTLCCPQGWVKYGDGSGCGTRHQSAVPTAMPTTGRYGPKCFLQLSTPVSVGSGTRRH